MNNNNAPFYPGQKIVRTGPSISKSSLGSLINGNTYTCNECVSCSCGEWKVYLEEFPCETGTNVTCNCGRRTINEKGLALGMAKLFAPLHYSSITAELAAQVQVGDTQDVKQKEVVCLS
jgi:hypothetical protein